MANDASSAVGLVNIMVSFEYTLLENEMTGTLETVGDRSDGWIPLYSTSYAEPYSSSTCEMAAEVLQYIMDRLNIRNPIFKYPVNAA